MLIYYTTWEEMFEEILALQGSEHVVIDSGYQQSIEQWFIEVMVREDYDDNW